MYSWGWNEYGQLGHKSFSLKKKLAPIETDDLSDYVSVLSLPKPVEFPNDEVIHEVRIIQFIILYYCLLLH